ncbi:unnamed protein product [Rangifer tarandus platyrhynchus]|uniref:Uncharacterized protein n=1 Tax=Rangifer tarandus platyrhynchus TaxID=3082113 RepID=A0ABN8Z8W9_RANTA|nr:unnamed protein product [Rangifer tarandus platyrhynchus]CAI9688727.1 unnamed protein product [Rangifer tarandus platyrhynchus]
MPKSPFTPPPPPNAEPPLPRKAKASKHARSRRPRPQMSTRSAPSVSPPQPQLRPQQSFPPLPVLAPPPIPPKGPGHSSLRDPLKRLSELEAPRSAVPGPVPPTHCPPAAARPNSWGTVGKKTSLGSAAPTSKRGLVGGASGATSTCDEQTGASWFVPDTTRSAEPRAPRRCWRRPSRQRNVRQESAPLAFGPPSAPRPGHTPA